MCRNSVNITDKLDRDDFQGPGKQMKKIKQRLTKTEHLEMSRKAWDAYHPYYTSFKLKKRPNFHQFFADGGVELR